MLLYVPFGIFTLKVIDRKMKIEESKNKNIIKMKIILIIWLHNHVVTISFNSILICEITVKSYILQKIINDAQYDGRNSNGSLNENKKIR